MVSRLHFRSTREDVVPVCLHVSSMSTFRILLLRGEGSSVFSNRHFVRCAVRSAARQHNVGCIVATHSICYVFKCVLISSVAVCFKVLCCTQARQPSIYHRCACVLHLAPAQKRTVESIFDSRNSPMLLPRTGFDRDSLEKDSRQDSSFIEIE